MSEEARRALELAEVEDPGEALCLPLSLGELRTDQDHSGERCFVLDIVFNTDVLKQAQSYRCTPVRQLSDFLACMQTNETLDIPETWSHVHTTTILSIWVVVVFLFVPDDGEFSHAIRGRGEKTLRD